jgi:hypothetical protein
MLDLDRLTPTGAIAAGRDLAFSAMPDASVVPDTPRRERRVRRFAERLVALRPQQQVIRLERQEA